MKNDFDIVIPLKSSLVPFFNKYTLPSLIKYFNLKSNKIIIVVNKHFINSINCNYRKILIIDEELIIDGLTKNGVENLLISQGGSGNNAGWYFQQFLKFGISKLETLSENFIIWDADAVILNKLYFIENDKFIFKVTDENNSAYFDFLEKVLHIKKQISHSFISENMIFNKSHVNELLDKIMLFKNNETKNWWEIIIKNINENELNRSGFSEYETYGNFMIYYYQNKVKIESARTYRNAKNLLGENPNKFDLLLMKLFFDYISFEMRENSPKNIFYKYARLYKFIFKDFIFRK